MPREIHCQLCEEPIHDTEDNSLQIRRCVEVHTDLCPSMIDFGVYHSECLPDEEPTDH